MLLNISLLPRRTGRLLTALLLLLLSATLLLPNPLPAATATSLLLLSAGSWTAS
jgi:hypothetical protein